MKYGEKSKEALLRKVEELRQSEEKYRLIAENTSDLVAIMTFKGTYTYISPSHRHLGYAPEDLLGKNGLNMIHPEDKKRFLPLLKQYLALSSVKMMRKKVKDLSEKVEYSFPDKSGKWHMMEATVNLVKSVTGTGYEILIISRDITGRKLVEKALKESEAMYRTIFENTGTATVLIEEDMKISMVNAELEELTGYPRKEIEGRKSVLDFVDSEYTDRVKENHRLREIAPEAVPRNYEIKIRNRKGDVRDVYLTVAMIPGTTRSIAALLDITELKRSEEQLKRQKELLDNTNKALEHKLEELEKAAGHIKRLEGLVPICVNCKKMRVKEKDPKDPGAWVPLERYLSEHTEASLTHGLCPDCVKKLYGETFKDRKEG
ncbi:MAG: PAS domain S-box protein [Candidatus Omnitrophota bacterium]|nr:PAS domain S-box protein [Candidatus Omnitrophota bacterium]